MKKMFVLFLLCIGCAKITNKAEEYAKLIYPKASCTPVITTYGCSSNHIDSAICTVGSDILECSIDTESSRPNCTKVGTMPAEAK